MRGGFGRMENRRAGVTAAFHLGHRAGRRQPVARGAARPTGPKITSTACLVRWFPGISTIKRLALSLAAPALCGSTASPLEGMQEQHLSEP